MSKDFINFLKRENNTTCKDCVFSENCPIIKTIGKPHYDARRCHMFTDRDEFMMSEKICNRCMKKDVCFMYTNIKEGRKWYSEYFGKGVFCLNFVDSVEKLRQK